MPAWKFLLAATIAVAACSPPAAAQGELGTPIGIPETERVSFELENDVYRVIRSRARKGKTGQSRLEFQSIDNDR